MNAEPTKPTATYRRLIRYLRPYWHLELITLLVMVAMAGLALALPLAVRYMIDTLIPMLASQPADAIDLTPAILFGAVLLGVYLANVVVGLTRDYLAAKIGAGIVQTIRADLFGHLQKVSLRFFHQQQIGEIMSRLLSDVHRIQGLLTTTLLTLVANLFMLIAILAYLLTVDWLLTVIAVIPVPVTIWLSTRYGRRLEGINRRLQETVAALSGRFQEAFAATKTIRAFGQERKEQRKVNTVLGRLTGLYVNSSVNTSLSVNLVHFVNMIGPIVVLAWGTYLIAGGSIKLGALIAFYMLLTYLYGPVTDLSAVNVEVRAAMASVYRIFEYLDLPVGTPDTTDAVRIERARGAIEFNNVSFAFEPEIVALREFSLSVAPGEKVAIVGPSGAGKTTIINLLMRFFDPTGGSVLLDSVELRTITTESLRRQFGLVEQEPVLFRGSIAENIAYAEPGATHESIVQAARVANIHEWILSLPGGYQTMIGERGVTVSGGERQRLCLARALLHNPPVMLLDEATSSLDSRSEALVQEALAVGLAGKTAIIVAHRLSTVRHADRIIVLDRGRLIDEGTHDSLLRSSPLYRELASTQLTA